MRGVCEWLHCFCCPPMQEMVQTAGDDEQEAAAEAAEAFLAEELPEAIFGAPKAGAGMWASCVRVMHPTEVGRGVPCDGMRKDLWVC